MRVLDRKLYRDLGRLWAQVLAIAMVMACGVAVIILAMGAYRSLEETRSAFYERQQFGSVFASATRAPLYLKERIERIPGVSGVELRIVRGVILDVPDMVEPATGIAVSLPDEGEPAVNRPYLRQGRLPEASRANEVAVVETFATAHGFELGDRFHALFNGKRRELEIVGIVLSAEYVYAIGPGDMMPDQRRFGIFYMPRKVLSATFAMQGAFDDVSLTTVRNADIDRVIDELDTVLEHFGGTGALGRKDQVSHAFLDSELTSLKAMAMVIPPIFLFVSAFLVNMILSRLIALEREQIGLLKALGYGDLSIAWHYAKLVILICMIGLVVGAAAGTWMGQGLTRLYAEFYTFPFLIFRRGVDLYVIAGSVTVVAALAGSAKAIWQTVVLPPAVAMRPPAPARYRSLFIGRLESLNVFSQLTVMAFRHLLRWPFRSLLTTFGTSLSVALLISATFSYDSIDYMIDTIFFKVDRSDATLAFSHDHAPAAVQRVAALSGILRVEPFRSTLAMLRNDHHERRMSIVGLPNDAELGRILDLEFNYMEPMPEGLMLSDRVADILDLQIGDAVEVELLEHDNRIVQVSVSAIVQSYVGLTVLMSMRALDRLLMDGPRVSGVRITIDEKRVDTIYAAVKATPGIASIALLDISRQRFRETIAENISLMMAVYITLAIIITFGVIYNSARIQLSERARELASLRVFGFTRFEVSRVLLIELAVIIVVAQPVGWILGYLFSWSIVRGFDSDLFRIPLIINLSTYATASLVVLCAAVASSLVVSRRVAGLDLVRVLKSRE